MWTYSGVVDDLPHVGVHLPLPHVVNFQQSPEIVFVCDEDENTLINTTTLISINFRSFRLGPSKYSVIH